MQEDTSSLFSDPSLYINRELSWLEFNQRVLEEAQDPGGPLLERLKFLCIVASSLDEFFEVRVAGVKQQRESNVSERGPDGMSPAEQLAAISARVRKIRAQVDQIVEIYWNDNVKAREQGSEPTYHRKSLEGERVDAQAIFREQARKRKQPDLVAKSFVVKTRAKSKEAVHRE